MKKTTLAVPRRSRSPSFLCGLLFDDRGNRMSPSHANKKGVRYRYYVSQALLQKREAKAGSIGRVAAPDIEELVVGALRHQVIGTASADEDDAPRTIAVADAIDRDRRGQGAHDAATQASPPAEMRDRDLVALHVERIVLRSRSIDITLQDDVPQGALTSKTIQIPWMPRFRLGNKLVTPASLAP